MHWAQNLIGKPYHPRGSGPEGFDCWGLCRFVWETYYSVKDLPDVVVPFGARAVRKRFAQEIENGAGVRLAAPFDGAAVIMSRARLPDHVGIYLSVDGGGVLHAIENIGVAFTSLANLRASGLNVLWFYRPVGMPWHTSISSQI